METHIPEVPREDYLDVCDMVLGVDEINEYDRHPMTLLAFAGYYGRKEMMDYLIQNGARKYLLQSMIWAFHIDILCDMM